MSMLPLVTMAALSAGTNYLAPVPQPGDPGFTNTPQHHFRLLFENDALFGDDQDYSHGTRLDYAQELSNGDAWGLSLVQNIYTPKSRTLGAVPGEHPYAGYMALGGAYLQRGRDIGAVYELQLGVTGNQSLARYSQKVVHELFDMYEWNGWRDQVPAEMVFQFNARQDFRLEALEVTTPNGWQTDVTFYTQEQIGTFRISAGAGIAARWGVNLPPSMQVTGNTAANYGLGLLKKPEYDRSRPSYFVVGSVYGGYVAHSLPVEGGVFRHFEHARRREPWQWEARLGLGACYKGVDYFAGAVYLSDTFAGQTSGTLFGSFAISLHW